MVHKVIALMKAGSIYTLHPCVGELRKCGFKHVGFRDGERVGFFKTRKDFENFVDMDPEVVHYDPACSKAFEAMTWSQMEGNIILQKLTEAAKKQKESKNGQHL